MRVVAEIGRVRSRPVIRLHTNLRLKSLDKRLAGAAWSKDHEAWHLDLTLGACHALRAEFGYSLEIGPKLWAWAETERRAQKKLAKLTAGRAKGVDLPRVRELQPRLYERLAGRPYQMLGAQFIARGRRVLLADQPSLGKTTQALAGVVESGVPGPYLVLAPVTALETVWAREVRAWLAGHEPAVISAGRLPSADRRNAALARHLSGDASQTWVITNPRTVWTKPWWECPKCLIRFDAKGTKSETVNCGHPPDKAKTIYETAHPALMSTEWGAVIVDESQEVLIRTSGTPTQVRIGACRLRVREDGLRVALSGTPMRGTPLKLWGTLNWLEPKKHSSFWTFAQRGWEVSESGWGGAKMIGRRLPEQEKALAALLDSTVMRRTKAEVYPDLPPKAYPSNLDVAGGEPPGIWLEMDPKQDRAYREMERMCIAELDTGTLTAVGGLAQLTRLKQFANGYGRMVPGKDGEDFEPAPPSNKMDWIEQWLRDNGHIAVAKDAEPQGKVIIASQFTKWLILMQMYWYTRYAMQSLRIVGSSSLSARTAAQDTFNDPNSGMNVLFVQTKTGGASITLDAADDMIILDETWIPDDQEQLEGRNDNRRPEERIAQRRYWYLKSLGTVDAAIAEQNAAMDRDQKQLLDGRRGVAYVRSVLSIMGGK